MGTAHEHGPAQPWPVDQDPASVRPAREHAAGAAASLGADAEAVDAVRLLVSEALTNMVLHARSAGLLLVEDAGDAVRVTVVDASPQTLLDRSVGASSTTGRGTRLLAVLAEAHGVEADDRVAPGGKALWFTVCKRSDHRLRRTAPEDHLPPPQLPEVVGPSARVVLRAVPLQIWERASEQSADLMRELALLEIGEDSGTTRRLLPRELLRLVHELQGRYGGLGDAFARQRTDALAQGLTELDVAFEVPVAIGPECARLDGLLDEADAFCGQGRDLMTLVPPPELQRFRRWFLGQLVAQVAGADPEPWVS